MSLRTTLFTIILINGLNVFAQLKDDFSDGNFTDPYVWSGDEADFEVDVDGKLHLVAPAQTDDSYLVTPNAFLAGATWEFYVEMGFNPSSSNQIFVYLAADQQNLEGSLNGYFVRIGNTSDEISLYRQMGTSTTEIIDGLDDVVDISSVAVRIKVTRDEVGNWELFRDEVGGTSYTSEGTAFDDTFLTSSYFGFLCDYTSTRSQLFWVDDVVISKELAIDTLIVQLENQIAVQFNQLIKAADAQNSSLFSVDDPDVNILSVSQADAASSTVNVELDSLPTGAYVLAVNNVRDSILAQPYSLTQDFEYDQIEVQSIETFSENTLVVTYNQPYDQASAQTLSHYSVDEGIGQPTDFDVRDESSHYLLFANTFQNGITYHIQISGVKNELKNSTLTPTNVSFEYDLPILVDTVFVRNDNEIKVQFNQLLEQSSAEMLANYQLSNGYDQPESASWIAADTSMVLQYPDLESDNYTLMITGLQDAEGDPLSGTLSVDFSYETLAITEVIVNGEQVEISFNQALDAASANELDHYSISGGIELVSVALLGEQSVALTTNELKNHAYTLLVNEVSNKIGNSTPALQTIFFNEEPTAQGTLLINEIMADPTPEVGLPNAEYVELYNPGDFDLTLSGFKLNGAVIDSIAIESGEYLVLLDDTDLALFSGINTVAVPSFDALTNGGDSVVLRDQFGNMIDAVTYDLSWYRDVEKDDGGYSLERINPDNPCSDALNWIVSGHPSGGTPGTQNSVFVAEDLTPPAIEVFEIIGSDSIRVSFSEAIDTTNFNFNQISIGELEIAGIRWESYASLLIVLQNPLPDEQFHTVTIADFADCLGNQNAEDGFTFYHDLKPPKLTEVFFLSVSEVALLFDEVLSESDAEKEVNFTLQGLSPKRAILQDSAQNRIHLEMEDSFYFDSEVTLIFNHLEDTLSNALAEQQFDLSYENEVLAAQMINTQVIEITFDFQPDPSSLTIHHLLIPELGRPEEVVIDAANAQKAIVSYSEELSENRLYSLYMERIRDTLGVNRSTPAAIIELDTRAPDLEQVVVLDSNRLKVVFSEALDPVSAILTSHYMLEDGTSPIEAILSSPTDVLLSFEESFEIERIYTLEVDDLKDVHGNAMKSADKAAFVYDPRPPTLNQVRLLSDSSILVSFHEKILADALSNDIFQLAETSPVSYQVQGPDSASITLYFTEWPEGTTDFFIDSIADVRGNVAYGLSATLKMDQPVISQVIFTGSQTMEVSFSHPMTAEMTNPAKFFLTEKDITNIQQLSDYSVTLTINQAMTEEEIIGLSVEDLQAQNGVAVKPDTTTVVFQTYFENLEVINSRSLKLIFNYPLGNVSNDFFTLSDENPQLSTQNETEVTLVFGQDFPENQTNRISWANLKDQFGRRIPDYAESFYIDTEAPAIDTIISDYLGSIEVVFSEQLLTSSVAQANSISITGLSFADKMFLADSIIRLDYGEQLVQNDTYTLVVKGIGDLADNYMDSLGIAFVYAPPSFPSPGDLMITEIMADPAPSIGLPEVEYLELYNASASVVQMNGLWLADEGKTVRLPPYELVPTQYMIIADVDHIDQFVSGEKLGVEGFPSLNNDGERLTIYTLEGTVIDQVNYSKEWYGDTEKDDGGYSLEIINLSSDCPGIVNWSASNSPIGGSPGEQNSLHTFYPDTVPPEILSVEIVSEASVVVNFNEVMDSLSLLDAVISVGEISVVAISILDANNDRLLVQFSAPLMAGKRYLLTIGSNLADCSGNHLAPFQTYIGIGRKPAFSELVITEIMPDPEPVVGLPNSEYLEIFNVTGDLISLGEVWLIDDRDSVQLPDVMLAPEEYLLLTPTSSIGLFSAVNAFGVPGWLSLANTQERIQLATHELIDQVIYSEDWHANEDAKDGGVSLEIIDPYWPCGGIKNWSSSTDPSGGTPGRQNAIFDQRPDQFGPQIKRVLPLDNQTIQVQFDEQLIPGVEDIAIGFSPSIAISEVVQDFSLRDQLVIRLGDPLMTSTAYELSIDNVSDCSGNVSSDLKQSFILGDEPKAGDIVISEILFNPRTEGVDFVELYNRSDQFIDLASMVITRKQEEEPEPAAPISNVAFLMAPSSYLAISEDTAAVLSQYPSEMSSNHFQSDLPTMPNDEGNVSLFNLSGEEIDAFDYSEDLHLGILESTDGVSLERIDLTSQTQDRNNWSSASSTVGFGTPGYENSQNFLGGNKGMEVAVDPRVFVPNSSNPAHASFTTIQYEFSQSGLLANVILYDTNGKAIAQLANGISLGTSGFFRWDGTNASGALVRPGYYVVFVEVYDGAGYSDSFKETVVVGR